MLVSAKRGFPVSFSLQSSRNPFLCSASSQAGFEQGTKILLVRDVANVLLLPQLISKLEIITFYLLFSMETVHVELLFEVRPVWWSFLHVLLPPLGLLLSPQVLSQP